MEILRKKNEKFQKYFFIMPKGGASALKVCNLVMEINEINKF